MTLTDNDWNRLFALLDAGWPGELSADQAAAYKALLDGIEPDYILAGLRRLLHAGARFRPTAAEILGEARQDASAPTFDEMVELVFGRRGVLNAQPPPRGLWIGESRRVACDAAAAERMSEMHPLIGSFVHRMTFGRLRRLDLENEWHRKELREGWATHCAAMEGREVAALASGSGREGLRRLDPMNAALPALPESTTETAA